MALDYLFSPMKIGGCTVPNRLVVPAMVMNYCNYDGTLTEKFMSYYEEKAKGGWGLIITEDYSVSEIAKGYDRIAGLYRDDQIEANKIFTERIHRHGSKIFCQIYHAGRQSHRGVNGGKQPLAPSPIPCPWKRELPKEMTKEDIKQVIKDFGDTALRVKQSGFDGVEVHAGHGYLLAEFMSQYSNKRSDEYGGCLANRARIIKEIITDIRSKVGEDFPVTIRFSTDERKEGGRTINEALVLARWFEEWGFDAIHSSTGVYGTHDQSIVANMYKPYGWNIENTVQIKNLVSIPVIGVCRIIDANMADVFIQMGKADFIAMGRTSLADPYFPNKAKKGDFQSIRHCIGCLQGCIFAQEGEFGSRCLVNPSLGEEHCLDYSKTENPKNVVVIGAGPGGLEAARAAAIKGHNVTLIEKQGFIGGQFKSAAYPPCKGGLAAYLSWMDHELKNLPIKVMMETTATKELIDSLKPDTIICATGGSPLMPPIKGIDLPHVVTAEQILLGQVQPADLIVVAGGGEVGGETAAFLAMEERGVSVVEMRDAVLKDLDGCAATSLLPIMEKYGVKQYVNTTVEEIRENSVVVSNASGTFELPAQQVVLGLGYKPNNALYEELKNLYEDVRIVGGAVKTSNAMYAIKEGFMEGMNI